MSIYVLCRGEYAEGHNPESAHATLEAAVAKAAKREGQALSFAQDASVPTRWLATVDRCDEWWIYEMTVPEVEAMRLELERVRTQLARATQGSDDAARAWREAEALREENEGMRTRLAKWEDGL